MESIETFLSQAATWIWGLPLLLLSAGGGLFLLLYSRFTPVRHIGHAIAVLAGRYDDPRDKGQISHYQALSTALAATVGMGNISGVAIAITIGGPGAVFWMWISAIVGMATKYFTCTLAILYRGCDSEGEVQGGPMYVIREGLGKRWMPLAVFFCLAGMVGCLPAFQANQLTQAIRDIVLIPAGVQSGFGINLTCGVVLSALVALVICGGLGRISKVASAFVPIMVVVYFLVVVGILLPNLEQVPHYLGLILKDAWTGGDYRGDPRLGGLVGGLIIVGAQRATFSNEAGIGTAPMAHGAAKTNEPVHEGLVASLGPVIDTLIVCTLTALAILTTEVWQSTEANGVTLTANAFAAAFPRVGPYLLLVCILCFSLSSLFSYSYFGTKCLSFLIGARRKHYYNYFYLVSVVGGAVASMATVVNVIDSMFALMAVPTMISTMLLAPKVMKETRRYFSEKALSRSDS